LPCISLKGFELAGELIKESITKDRITTVLAIHMHSGSTRSLLNHDVSQKLKSIRISKFNNITKILTLLWYMEQEETSTVIIIK
jgi:hypothetical protein